MCWILEFRCFHGLKFDLISPNPIATIIVIHPFNSHPRPYIQHVLALYKNICHIHYIVTNVCPTMRHLLILGILKKKLVVLIKTYIIYHKDSTISMTSNWKNVVKMYYLKKKKKNLTTLN
jgi:hypothetical protein